MNNSQLNRYAALESRLPEGKFPRLGKHGFTTKYGNGVPVTKRRSSWHAQNFTGVRPITDLERLGFDVLVLRACLAENIVDEGRFDRAVILGDQSAIADTLTDLESAYPATEGGVE